MEGRTEIMSRLLAEHSHKLIAYSRLTCRDLELARDAVADTFYKLCGLESIYEEKAAAWLYKTCKKEINKFCPRAGDTRAKIGARPKI